MIVRRIEEVEKIDVGVPFGAPEGMMVIQWIFSNQVGDGRYHHKHAIRKYTLQPGVPLEMVPFHNHTYVQCPYILKGRMVFENEAGDTLEAGPGDTVIFYENEPHRGTVLGMEPVELLCIIDCPGDGADCIPEKPKKVSLGSCG
ncbi:MAG: cupin domain-containing protein [Proteobacteria bacterium]|nr:cupin domain-containing protein [Pseudomonadota bacterium]